MTIPPDLEAQRPQRWPDGAGERRRHGLQSASRDGAFTSYSRSKPSHSA